MKNLLVFLLLLAGTGLCAQGLSVRGTVVDGAGGALPGATVVLLQPDSSVVKGAVTDTAGTFVLNDLLPGNYILKVSQLGLLDFFRNLTLTDRDIHAGALALRDDSQLLQEVQVVEQAVTATQQGDTLQFNSAAFKTRRDADAQELLEKVPGVTVEDGQVKAQGENVQQVLVDGKPFFGDDASAALRNVPAELIDKVQIFDAQSEQAQFTGFNDGTTVKTVNIVTKSGMQNGQFGKVYGGYGSDRRYQFGGNLNYFDGNRRLSLVGISNNVNVQNFAMEDLLGAARGQGGGNRAGMSGGRRGGGGQGGNRNAGNAGGGRGGGIGDFLVSPQGGVTTTHAVGLNYADQWGKKVELTASYFFNKGLNNADESLYREYVGGAPGEQIYRQEEQSHSNNINHRFNLRLEYRIDSFNSLLFRPRLSLQQNAGSSNTLAQTNMASAPLNAAESRYQSDLDGMNFTGSLLWRHKFARPGRTLSLDVTSGYAPKKGESTQQAYSVFYDEGPTRFDTISQRTGLDINSWNIAGNLEYTEPLGPNAQLLFNYRHSYQQESSDRQTFDRSEATGGYDRLNEPLSNVFSNDYQTQQGGLGYNYSRKKAWSLSFRLNGQWASLLNEQTFPQNTMLDKTFFNVLPSVSLRYEIDRNHNFRFNYRSNTQLPSVQQLQNVVDNSNPLNLVAGNPDLNQAGQHNFFVRYQATDPARSRVFFMMAGGGFARNYIANSVYYAGSDSPVFNGLEVMPGAQLTRPVNLNDYYTARSFLTYGFPVRKIKSNLNLDVAYNFTRNPGLVNEQTNYANTHSIGAGFTLGSNVSERLDFTLSVRPTWNSSRNSLSTGADADFWRQNSRLRFNWEILNSLVLRTDLFHTLNQGLSEQYNQQYWLWNAAIGIKLFRNGRGEISLAVNDLLNQNRDIRRTVTESYIEDAFTNALTRYVMLTFTYNLRNFNAGTSVPAGSRRPPAGMPPPPGQ